MREYFMPSDEPTAEQPFDIDDNAPNDVEFWKSNLPNLHIYSILINCRGCLGRNSTSKVLIRIIE
jgi:hypothetical protein